MTLSLPIQAEKLLPHRKPMCCIDELTSISATSAIATVRLSLEHSLMDAGSLHSFGYIEIAAQTAGAMQGYFQLENNSTPKEGFLVAVQNVEILAVAQENETLYSEIEVLGEYQGVSVISFRVYSDHSTKATGKLKVYVAEA